jgi:hypothetical protein
MPLEVPVAAHRLFGTVHRRFGLAGAAAPPVIDMNHGTRRSLESIRAFFSDEPSLPHTAGWSVNGLWAPRDVAFALTGIEDHMIDSDKADLLPLDVREEPDWTRLNRRGAINIYFLHEIEGAWGKGFAEMHPNRYRVPYNRVVVADRWHLDEGHVSLEESWRQDVIVLAHELGHALTLPHTANVANIMFGNGTTRDSVELTPAQGLAAWQHGWKYSTAAALGDLWLGWIGRLGWSRPWPR